MTHVRKFRIVLLIAVMVVTFGVNFCNAETITADADAHVYGANTNYGTATALQVNHRSDIAAYNRKAYIRFDLSDFSFNGDVTDAALNLNFVSGLGVSELSSYTFNVFGLDDGHAGESWVESGITWNNAPANNSSGDGVTSDAQSLGTFSVTGRGIGLVSFSSDALDTFINSSTSNDLATFIITRSTAGNATNSYLHTIASKEHGTVSGPQLSGAAVPEPSSIVLLICGATMLLGVARLRKRRA